MSKSTLSLGIIIPVYNRPFKCWTSINSVIKQTTPPDSLVIVDDGSSDATPDIIDNWIKKQRKDLYNFPIKLLRQKNMGAAQARNSGIKEVNNCDLVLFLDCDDYIPADFIERTLKLMHSHPQAVAVSTPRLTFFDNKLVFDDLANFACNPIEWMFYYGASILSCTVFRKKYLPQEGFVKDIKVGEDMILAAEVSTRGDWLISEGEAVRFYRSSRLSNLPNNDLLNGLPPYISKDPANYISEEPNISQNDGLSLILEGIQVRSRIFKSINSMLPRPRISASFVQSVLSEWWFLAAHKSSQISLGKESFFIRNFGKYAWFARYWSCRKWYSRLLGS